MTEHLKDLTEKQRSTYNLLRDFARNNSLPFSIKAYEIGEQVGYKVTPGEKEGYEPYCSGAESCMQALRGRRSIVYDVRRHTGFIVKNIKTYSGRPAKCWHRVGDKVEGNYEWMKTVVNPITHYEYELDTVIKFNKELLDKWIPEEDFAKDCAEAPGKTIEELKEEKLAIENSVKIKINEIDQSGGKPKDILVDAPEPTRLVTISREWKSQVESRLMIIEDWKSKVEPELIVLRSRIDRELDEDKEEREVDSAELGKEQEELSKSRDLVWSMMDLSRFFRAGVRKDNNIVAKKPDLQEFSRISGAINGGAELRIDSFKHNDIHVAEMCGAIVVVLSARDNPKFFVSMNKEEKELYNHCSKMFTEFDLNDFQFHSDSYCLTSYWNIKREQKFAASPPECSGCHRSFDELKRSGRIIQVHHISYDSYARIFRENLEDLAVLCKECHEKKHPEKQKDSNNANHGQ